MIQYGDGLTSEQKQLQKDKFDKLPPHLKQLLKASGTKVFVGTRADQTPGWDAYAKATGRSSTDTVPDGRQIGTLSFYIGSRNELYISVNHPGGSVNVYTHELGHAVDLQITGDGSWLSNNWDFEDIHNKYIRTNDKIRAYFKEGSRGTAESGRKESFAEGLATYFQKGLDGLTKFVHSREAAELMVDFWKKNGVIK